MQIKAISLGKDMEVHLLWPWIVMGGIDTFCLCGTLENPKEFCKLGEVQVQRVNLFFFKADGGCLKLIASPMAGIETRSRESKDTYKEHGLGEKHEGTIKAARSPRCR